MATLAARLVLNRTADDGVQTTGEISAIAADGRVLGRWFSLERPWKDNTRRKSCIPTGRYWVEHRYSRKFKHHLHVTDVDGRSWILIHPGNTWRHVVGCIMAGLGVGHVDRDGRLDLTGSRSACTALRKLVPEKGVWLEVYAPDEAVTGDREQHGAYDDTPARLARGSRSEDVTELTARLIELGFLSGSPGPIFGPKTEAAVRAFQKSAGLVVDGVAGPNTLDALEIE